MLDSFFTGRWTLWQEAIQLWSLSPLVGHGFHAHRLWMETPYRNDPSNAWVTMLLQTGLLGLVGFVWGWTRTLKTCWASPINRVLVVALLLRTLVESSTAYYGLDWLLLLSLGCSQTKEA